MYKVVAYGRVSTKKEEQQTSIENQKLMFENYVKQQGWNLSKIYMDKSSGTKAKRKELEKLIEDIKNQAFEVLIVKDLSRLARNGELSLQIGNLLLEKNIYLVSLDGMVNTMEGNSEMLGLLSWIYQKESESLSHRIKSAKEIAAINGKYTGSLPPYGYNLVKGNLIKREDNTPDIVKEIFNDYMKGVGIDTIAAKLTLRGVPTPAQITGKSNAGTDWVGSTVKNILKNPHYTGALVQKRTTSISVVSTKRRVISKKEQIVVESTHEEIISRSLFEAVQEQMKLRKKNLTAPKAHLFTNVVFCADCGKGMWFRSNQSKCPTKNRYICGGYARKGKRGCSSSHSIKEIKLKEALINGIESFIEMIDCNVLSNQFKKKLQSSIQKSTKDLKKIDSKIAINQQRRINYVQMLADSEDIDKELVKMALKRAEQELRELTNKRKLLKTSSQQSHVDLEDLEKCFRKYIYSDKILPEFIHRFVSKIEVREDEMANIYYNFQDPKLQQEVS
ncbi:recombinase family protein [Bacillus zanthoxyli]|nr:recombinase family protein [Bacillus zanthoxyli]